MLLKMHLKKSLSITLLSGAFGMFSLPLFADATLHFKRGQGANSETHNLLFIKDQKIHLSQSENATGQNYSLFDAKSERIIHVNPKEKAYMVMDKPTIDKQVAKMKQSIEMMRQQMEEKLKTLPANEQKMMRKMMEVEGLGPKGKAPPKPKKQHNKTGKFETIQGIRCEIVEVLTNHQKSEELCVSKETEMGLTASDAETLIAMKKFMNYMAQSARNAMPNQSTEENFDGIPIRTKSYDRKGKLVGEIVLGGFSKQAIKAEKVKIPDNYKQVDTPQMH